MCSVETNKYKCPKCRKLYCSVACYKVHKESCKHMNHGQTVKDANEEDKDQAAAPKPLGGVEVLSTQRIDKLRQDPYIRRILGSKRLQEHIRTIDSAEDRAEALRKKRKSNKEFHEFVQKMMVIVEETL